MTDEERESILALAEKQELADAQNDDLIKAYNLTFNSPSGQVVLLDLMGYGRFRAPIADPIDEGKRRVILRIVNFISLTKEQLLVAYRGEILPRV
jgi:hypothetical protein